LAPARLLVNRSRKKRLQNRKEHLMQGHTSKRRLAVVGAIAALGLVASAPAATRTLPGDTGVPFWPYETGVLVGTSETYVDLWEDGSYYDPGLEQRVSVSASTPKGGALSEAAPAAYPGDTAVPFWPYETGVLVGTSETYVDVWEDGSYYDPGLGRRVSVSG
jgi:hypothetical protein